jgi:hypothetical protein
VLKYDEHPRCRALRERMNASEDPDIATTIISAEEQMRRLRSAIWQPFTEIGFQGGPYVGHSILSSCLACNCHMRMAA